MNISFDESQLEQQLQATATEAMGQAFQAYSVQSQIREAIAEHVLRGALGAAIVDAMSRVDLERLTTSIAEQLTRHIAAATVALLTESTVDMLYHLRGGHDYDSNAAAVKDRLRADLRADISGRGPKED